MHTGSWCHGHHKTELGLEHPASCEGLLAVLGLCWLFAGVSTPLYRDVVFGN